MNQHFSDEFINSYLDNELGSQECEELLNAVRYDDVLSTRVCKLKNVKEMVQLAYQTENLPAASNSVRAKSWLSIAASVVLVAGVSIGWLAKSYNSNQHPSLTELARSVQLPLQSNVQNRKNWKLMLHVVSNDPKRYNALINETEALLKTSLQNNESVEIEVLTNGPGLSLVTNNDKKFTKRLNQLAEKYDNFTLLACKKALKRLKVEKGISLKLVPEAATVNSALNHVIMRHKQGWSYIQI